MKNIIKKMNSNNTGFAGLLTITFIVLKLTGFINWSWWWVLSPVLISGGILFLSILILLFIVIILASSHGNKK